MVGANGAGKTNLLLIIGILKGYYLNTLKKRKTRFSFDESDSVSELSLKLEIEERVYTYELQMLCNEDRFLSEKLFCNEELVLDSKLNSDIGKLTDAETERLKTYDIERLGVYGLIRSKEVVIENKKIFDEVNKVGEFFKSILLWDDSVDVARTLLEDKEVKNKVIMFLNRVDIDIEDIIVEKGKFINGLEYTESDDENLNTLSNAVMAYFEKFNGSNEYQYKIIGYKRKDLKNVVISSNESRGTKALIELMTKIYDNKDCIIIIDEIEKRLHEKLLMSVINEIKNNAVQVIFTSHLIETLNVLDKKEFYSVYKKKGRTKVIRVEMLRG